MAAITAARLLSRRCIGGGFPSHLLPGAGAGAGSGGTPLHPRSVVVGAPPPAAAAAAAAAGGLAASSAAPSPTATGAAGRTSRTLSTRGKRAKGGRGGRDVPLMNERLIKALLRGGGGGGGGGGEAGGDGDGDGGAGVGFGGGGGGGGGTARSVRVRLVVDRGGGVPSDIDVVTLESAMETSRDLGVDLLGISLDQDIPVVKAIDYRKQLYEQGQRRRRASVAKGAVKSGLKQVKEFKFKAGIDDDDLRRKAQNMIKYLSKGHTCQVVITARQYRLREDKNAVTATLDRVRGAVGDIAVEQGAVRMSEEGNFANATFQPNPKKSKSG